MSEATSTEGSACAESGAGGGESKAESGAAGGEATPQASETQTAETAEQLPEMVLDILSEDPATQLRGTGRIRDLLDFEKPRIQPVVDDGRVVPRLVEFLHRDDNMKLQYEAAWALTNIASGTTLQTRTVVNHGAIPLFVRLLASPDANVSNQAVWALANIAGDSVEHRDLVLGGNALPPLLELLSKDGFPLNFQRKATWALHNFCQLQPTPLFAFVAPALPTLVTLIANSNDDEVLGDACWAISYLIDDCPNEQKQVVIEAGVCPRLVELITHSSSEVQRPAVSVAGNIVAGDAAQTQMMLDCGVLPCLLSLLGHTSALIRKDSVWAISNITAGTHDQIQMVIDAGIIPPVINLLSTEDDEGVRTEAAWAISNTTTNGNASQTKYLVEQGCIAPLCSMLSSQVAQTTRVVLRGLHDILKVGEEDLEDSPSRINLVSIQIEGAGGVERIKALRNHSDEDIQQRATKTLEALYGCAEIEEDPRSLYHQHVAALVAASSFDVNETRVAGRLLPLHYTIRHEDAPCLEMLLGMDGANVNLRDGEKGMPLHVATAYGRSRCIELLLAAGADVNAEHSTANPVTPLFMACGAIAESMERFGTEDGRTGEATDDPTRGLVLLLQSRNLTAQNLARTITMLRPVMPSEQQIVSAEEGGKPLTKHQKGTRIALPVLEAEIRGERRWCAGCLRLTPDKDLPRCTGCLQVAYCLPPTKEQQHWMYHEERDRVLAMQCQMKHWKKKGGHKMNCKRWAAEEKEAAAARGGGGGGGGGAYEGKEGKGDDGDGAAGGDGEAGKRKKKKKKKKKKGVKDPNERERYTQLS